MRRPGRAAGASLAFVVAGEPASVRRIELDSPDGLADVDLDRAGELSPSPLVLVCGHGSRDRCCAVRGTAVFGALASELEDEVAWISSHQGGHRFAANVLVLPAGLQLGRVDPGDALRVVTDALRGVIDLDRYRGCSRYDGVEQAADIAVRRALGLRVVDELSLVGSTDGRVRLLDRDGHEHVALVEEVAGPVVSASCGEEAKQQTELRVRLVARDATSGAGTPSR